MSKVTMMFATVGQSPALTGMAKKYIQILKAPEGEIEKCAGDDLKMVYGRKFQKVINAPPILDVLEALSEGTTESEDEAQQPRATWLEGYLFGVWHHINAV